MTDSPHDRGIAAPPWKDDTPQPDVEPGENELAWTDAVSIRNALNDAIMATTPGDPIERTGAMAQIVHSKEWWIARARSEGDMPVGAGVPDAQPAEDALVKHMVDRFLGWRLPENFSPDAGISFKRTFNEHTAHPMKSEPTGTNLFDAEQATAMVSYMLDGFALAVEARAALPFAGLAEMEDLAAELNASAIGWREAAAMAAPPSHAGYAQELRDYAKQLAGAARRIRSVLKARTNGGPSADARKDAGK